MLKRSWSTPLFALLLLFANAPIETAAGRRLEVQNRYTKPEDALRYYLERDAAGFVYSGLLEIERREFTEWTEAPAAESYLVARSYRISKAIPGADPGETSFEVDYELLKLQDASGGTMPVQNSHRKVRYVLRQNASGRWRITSPPAKDVVPVVIEAVASPSSVK